MTPTVCVGQIYADNDPRCDGRHLTVHAIEGDKAVCYAWYDNCAKEGRNVRVRIDRLARPLGTRGYRLVREAVVVREATS